MIRIASLILAAVALTMIVIACDNYSHNSIANTPPADYVDLAMSRTYGGLGYDWGSSLVTTEDDEYIITGSTTSNGYGDNTVYLARAASNGDLVWSTYFGGWGEDCGSDLTLTSDGFIVIAGVSSSWDLIENVKIDPNSGKTPDDYNFYLIKTNMAGLPLWEKAYGDTGYVEWGTSVAVSPTGYLVVGYQHKSEAEEDFFFIKTDTGGNELWRKVHETDNVDRAYSVIRTSDGNFVAAGYSTAAGGGLPRPYLVKVDDNGNVVWERVVGNMTSSERIFEIIETSDGGIAGVGTALPASSAVTALYVLKTDGNGQQQWANAYAQSGIVEGRSILENPDGSLIVCGQNAGQNAIQVAKLNAGGNLLWADSSGVAGFGMSVSPCEAGYVITGSTTYPDHRLLNDVLLIKVVEDLTNVE
ncbi:MAG: hypothetical protein JSU74_13040 [Candidatus Zixiibacteriota bacterium]|nr:MAG: hypothetical protein JSU74_13040 [candidate division Zixibacteria bacterium]